MMMAGLNPAELVELALMLVAVGALSGFFAGIFGIGGGAILVPVFYECFRLAGVPLEGRMPLCIGNSLAIIIPTSVRSYRAHYARGAVDMETLKAWWLPVLIGVVAGSVTARYAPERLFKIVFVGLAWSAAARLLLARAAWKFGEDLAQAHGHRRRIVFKPADDILWPSDSSGGRDLVGAGGADLDSRRARLCLCRLARRHALSRCRRTAIAVCDRVRLADRRCARHADQPFDRAARSQSRACDVEARPGNGIWGLPFHRRRKVCDKSAVRAIATLAEIGTCSMEAPPLYCGLIRLKVARVHRALAADEVIE